MSGSGGVLIIACVVVTLVVSAVIVRYVQVVTALRSGAEKICNGDFSQTIEVGGGDLGSIAESINNIGIGINAAVEERMKSERLKTELITNVSHDIRTPLTSIITYTDLLKHEGLDCEKAPEYLDILIQKSQRLKTLTDELFEAAKAATGNIEVSITELDIVSLINQVMGEMDTAIANSDLDIRFSHPDHLMIKADGRLMWRVMENLLSNVLKYALPSSRVYLAVSHAGAPYVHIEIKNVSAQELNVDPSELTERFKRGDDSRTDGGSGLGLAIVWDTVRELSGKVTAEPRAEGGMSFQVRFARYSPPETSEE
jgi:signal transduction histidine kinase